MAGYSAVKPQLITELKGLKVYVTIKMTFQKQKDNGVIIKTAYFNSKPHIITGKTNIYKTLELISQQVLNMIGQWLSEGSGWVIQSVDNHYLNIVDSVYQ